MEVTLIGMGPGDPSALTGGALTALERADVLIGSRRLVEGCTLAPEAQRFCSTKSAEIVEILAEGRWERPCVLYSGDTGFHSGTRTLLPQLAERGISWRVLPGVSSMQYFAARLDRPWQEWRVVSAHGLACDPVGEVLAARGRPVFFLTGGAGGAAALCRRLARAGLGSLTAAVGEALSYPEERIVEAQVWELAEQEFSTLSVLLVDGAAPVWPVRSQGIDDGAFLRGEVPMTKQEVRAAALAKLEVRDGAVYWDVGAGTGSVSVELALLAPRSQVYAVEYKGEACALIRANRERFGAYNLEVAEGRAPAALAELPAPDTRAPQAFRKFCRSTTSGSRAALEITVTPSAPQAASIRFSVAPTDGIRSTTSRPRSRSARQWRKPPSSRISAPRSRRPARWRSIGRGPSSHPPG